MGYSRAGFRVVGIDISPQPRYPFDFVRGDAIEHLAMLLQGGSIRGKRRTYYLSDFSAINASPPCQRYSMITVVHGKDVVDSHPDLIDATRKMLVETGLPYVIENVARAPMNGSLLLCGSMFGLGVRRHRIFEGDVPTFAPYSCNHSGWAVPVYGHSGAGANRNRERERGRNNSVSDWAVAMGIDWMTGDDLAEAIPPAYTEYIGRHLLRLVAVQHRVQPNLPSCAAIV